MKQEVPKVIVTTLKLDKEEVNIHAFSDDLYYIEDSTGIYKMQGNSKDYKDYLTNKGWVVVE